MAKIKEPKGKLIYCKLVIMKDLIPVYYDSLTEKEKQELPKVPTFNPKVHKIPVNWEGKFDKSQIIKKGESR